MTTRSQRSTIFFIGTIGGTLAVIFGAFAGPAYSHPIMQWNAGFAFYIVFLILAPFLAVVGGILVARFRRVGALFLFAAALGVFAGYGLSPAALIGAPFLYGAYQGMNGAAVAT